MDFLVERDQDAPGWSAASTKAVTSQQIVVNATEYSTVSANGNGCPLFFIVKKMTEMVKRAHHRDDLAPGIDAPPEPAQQVEQARAGADRNQDFERVLGRLELAAQNGRDDIETNGAGAADVDVVLLDRRPELMNRR